MTAARAILVTGADGFVGRAVHRRLARDGRSVALAVRRKPDDRATAPRHAVGDVGSDTRWGEALRGIDVVIHLAARVHVMRDAAVNPLAEFRGVNVDGTANLARHASAAGVKRLVFVSSIKVSGEGTAPGRPFRADDAPSPAGDYARSKHEAERALFDIGAETGLEIVVVRPPLVYGPGVRANFLSMMRWVHRGIPLPFGSVDNRRSLVSLENLVDLLCVCADHPRAAGEVFLAADGDDLSTPELLRGLARALRAPSRVFPAPVAWLEAAARLAGRMPIFERLCGSLQIDIAKSHELLGWRPPTSVDSALEATAADFLSSHSR